MNIRELLGELEAAKLNYQSAEDQVSIARKAETEALNKLNALQDAFDKEYARLKAESPIDSRWRRKTGILVEA